MKITGYSLLAFAMAMSLIFYGVVFYQLGISLTDITGIGVSLTDGITIDLKITNPYAGLIVQTSMAPLLISLMLACSGVLLLVAASIYRGSRARK